MQHTLPFTHPPAPPTLHPVIDQILVLLNDVAVTMDALECMAAADVMVGSESKFSKAAAAMSVGVKVLTDQWEVDEDEEMVALDPAQTVAGMAANDQTALLRAVEEWHACSLAYKEVKG